MFTLEIDTENAAFEDYEGREEVARILRVVADKLEHGLLMGRCIDSNGNEVGTWGLSR